jgi:hypothetical protein
MIKNILKLGGDKSNIGKVVNKYSSKEGGNFTFPSFLKLYPPPFSVRNGISSKKEWMISTFGTHELPYSCSKMNDTVYSFCTKKPIHPRVIQRLSEVLGNNIEWLQEVTVTPQFKKI